MELPHFSYVPILFGDTVNIIYWNLKIHFSPEEAYSVFLVEIFLLLMLILNQLTNTHKGWNYQFYTEGNY